MGEKEEEPINCATAVYGGGNGGGMQPLQAPLIRNHS